MTSAYVFVQLGKLGGMSEVGELHKAMHAAPGVKMVHMLAGPTDMVVYVEVADQGALVDTIGRLRGINGVASTDTRIVVPMP